MIGQGRYDDVAAQARIISKARGVLLIVFDGEHGHGFSAQLPPEIIGEVPRVLRQVATLIEHDVKHQSLVAAISAEKRSQQ